MRYLGGFAIALALFALIAWAQAPVGSSMALGLGTANCQSPTTGQTILCGTSTGLQVSTNGAAYIPAAGTLNYQNALAAVNSNNTNDVTLYTYTLPAGTVAASQGIRIEACFQHTSGTATSNYRLKFGATTVTFISTASGTLLSCFAASVINNPGMTNAQQMIFLYGTPPGTAAYAASMATPAENTSSSAVNILLTASCMSSCTSQQWTPDSWLVTKIQ